MRITTNRRRRSFGIHSMELLRCPGDTNDIPVSSHDGLKHWSSDSLELRLKDPWVRKLPMDVLIPLQLEAIAQSKSTAPFKLIVVGKNLLSYIQEAKVLLEIHGSENSSLTLGSTKEAAVQFPKLLKVFDDLFGKIIETKDLGNAESVKEFYDHVWQCAIIEGKIDFSNSRVIRLLLDRHPEYLQPIIVESLKSCNPDRLITLCRKYTGTFSVLLTCLSKIYHQFNRHDRIIRFTSKLLKTLEHSFGLNSANFEIACAKYISTYPPAFHPLLWVTTQIGLRDQLIQDQTVRDEAIFENSELRTLLLQSIDDLLNFPDASQDERNSRLFFLVTNHTTLDIITKANNKQVVRLKQFPCLWIALNTNNLLG